MIEYVEELAQEDALNDIRDSILQIGEGQMVFDSLLGMLMEDTIYQDAL